MSDQTWITTAGQYGPYAVVMYGLPTEFECWLEMTWKKPGNHTIPYEHWKWIYPKWDFPLTADSPDPALLRDLLVICRSYIDVGYYQSMPLYRYIEKMMGLPDAQ